MKSISVQFRQLHRWARSFIPSNVRFGPLYRRQLAFLMESQWHPAESHRAFQLTELRALLRHAFRHVPYYRDIAARHGISEEDFRGLADLGRLPILTRETVRDHQEQLLSEAIPAVRRVRRYTGGTSGTPLGFMVEAGRTDPLERAFVARLWSWFGLRFEDSAALFRGYALDPALLRRGEYWQRWLPERRWLAFSSFHMNEETLPRYAERLRKLDPAMISCVASDLDPLARYWIQQGLPPLARIKAIHQSGMVIYPDQRERLEAAFGARVFASYGQSECTVLASECECSGRYHVFPEYGITEILRRDGSPAVMGEVGEIVATGFGNRVLPFIRYRTGDMAAWSARQCRCGRNFPLFESMEGRGQYMVVSLEGGVISLNSILYGSHLAELRLIREIQVRQDRPGHLDLVLVPSPELTREAELRFVQALQRVTDGTMEFHVRRVDHLPRVSGEKFKILIQELDVDWWAGYRTEAGAT